MVNVLSSSGLRIGEAVQIELDGIKLDQDPPTIYLEAEKTKGRAHARYIFISYRAKQVLQEWIDYRTEYAKRASKIGRGYTFDPAEDNRLFPFYQTTFTNKWNLACQKAGFDEKDKTTNRSLLTPHKLRKYFRSQGWSIPDAPEALMGRRSRYNATYAKMLQVSECFS